MHPLPPRPAGAGRVRTETTISSPTTTDAARAVVVAMLTYRRPDDLATAIPAVLEHTLSLEPRAELLIVDNDPAGSAAAAVTAFAESGVRYVHEPRPGIAAARNRALDEAPHDALLIFIDDDETPQKDWLQLLLATYQKYRSVAVVGPVVSEYEVEPEEWIQRGRYFERLRRPTGSTVAVAATNNLLLDLQRVNAMDLRFDERFGQSGGSDTLFTRRLAAAAGPFTWCDEAVVIDRVPAARLSRRWVLSRAFRSGNSWVRTSLELAPSARSRLVVRLRTVPVGGVRILGGATKVAAGLLGRSMALRAQGFRTIARGAGMASAGVGYVYLEYRRPVAAKGSA